MGDLMNMIKEHCRIKLPVKNDFAVVPQLQLASKPLETSKDIVKSTSELPIRSIVVPSSMVTSVTEAPKSRSN